MDCYDSKIVRYVVYLSVCLLYTYVCMIAVIEKNSLIKYILPNTHVISVLEMVCAVILNACTFPSHFNLTKTGGVKLNLHYFCFCQKKEKKRSCIYSIYQGKFLLQICLCMKNVVIFITSLFFVKEKTDLTKCLRTAKSGQYVEDLALQT